MPYNLTLVNGSGLLPLVQTVNTNLMEGWFGTLMLIALFAIFFMTLNTRLQDPTRAFSMAALVCAVVALPLRTLGLTSDVALFVCWGLAVGSMVLVFFTKSG